MPLNRPALSVGSGPDSVQQARRWVTKTITDIGRAELAENAELGVSELVTNAVLHGAAPILVRVRGTADHPRIEVADSSLEPPVLPRPFELDLDRLQLEEHDLLIPFGHGLDIVARCADAWGAEIEEDGKIVWFVPSAQCSDTGVAGTITGGHVPMPRRSQSHDLSVRLLDVVLQDFLDFEVHFRALRREVRLLALAYEDDYPLAKRLSDLFGSLERELREGIDHHRVDDARQDGRERLNLLVRMSADAATRMGRFVELLDFADDFCREENLLSLARSDRQVEFQTWFFNEFVRQARGEKPIAMSGSAEHADA